MAAFSQELPENVDVETVTLIAFSDGRPAEIILAGTLDDRVRHGVLNSLGHRAVEQFLRAVLTSGCASLEYCDGSAG